MRQAAYQTYAGNFTEKANHNSLMQIYERAIGVSQESGKKSRQQRSAPNFAETR
ncbi:hypothetical protein MJC1_04045 [Methylocystis sp. MJC1]|nr:hypothetical protein MJC1_04045 [Methylocystis sp. MJC1]